MDRRQLLRFSWKGALAALVGLAAYPSLHFWWRSARLREGRPDPWADLGPLSRIEEGRWLKREATAVRRRRWRTETSADAVYVRRSGEAVEVLSAVCPHTGCLVRMADEGFACPCHRSRFDASGRAVDGPSPRPLDHLEWKVERGRVLVRYQRFRPGRPTPELLEG